MLDTARLSAVGMWVTQAQNSLTNHCRISLIYLKSFLQSASESWLCSKTHTCVCVKQVRNHGLVA